MTGQTERTTIEAEQATLGAMMLNPAVMWRILDLVTATDFHDPKHQVVFEAIHQAAQSGNADVISVTDHLIKTGDLHRAGGVDYLHTLTSATPTAANGEYHAEIVARHAGLRRLSEVSATIAQGVADGRDVDAIVDDAKSILERVTDVRTELRPIGDEFDDLADEMSKPPSYVLTRWRDVNNFLGGLMPGAVYVVAARPGGGKSMLALNMAVDLAKHGTVAFVSFEMMKPEIFRRLLAAEAEVSLTKLERNRLEQGDWERVRDARARVKALPLVVDDRMSSSITQIEASIRQIARRGKLAGVVIDYLQLIPSTDYSGRQSRAEFIGTLTRAFKMLAKKLGVPVILLSQLNRESEKGDRLPTLADLRESGSIEQDADVVLFLARRRDQNGQWEDVVDVIVAKNRSGAMGRLELDFEGRFARLVNRRFGDPDVDWKARQAGD